MPVHFFCNMTDRTRTRSGSWPESPWSLIRRAREGNGAQKQRLLDSLLRLYYRPVSRFFQKVLGLQGERLEDVTQDFFMRFVEKDFLKNIRHETSFRNFLKVACRRHYIKWIEAERARKKPGGRSLRSLEGVEVGEEQTSAILNEELRAELLAEAVRLLRERLEAKTKSEYFVVFEARMKFDGSRPVDYETIAKRTGCSVFDVGNYLTAARKIFRDILIELVSESADDPSSELRELGFDRYL